MNGASKAPRTTPIRVIEGGEQRRAGLKEERWISVTRFAR
jgi:hypothetical protein